jgi:hypothetical protein
VDKPRSYNSRLRKNQKQGDPDVNEIADLDAEIARIASDPARKQAFELFANGRLADGLKCLTPYPHGWEDSQRIDESSPLWDDKRLLDALTGKFIDGDDDLSLFEKACSQIDLWGASPLEVALRKGTIEAFERALDEVCSPQRRFETAGRELGKGWSSLRFREFMGMSSFSSQGEKFDSLISLAVLLGKSEAAAMMIWKGWNSLTEGRAEPLIWAIQQKTKKNPEKTAAWMQVDPELLLDIPRLLLDHMNLEEAFSNIFKNARKPEPLRKKAMALLDKNPPISHIALGVATRKGDIELLNRLFTQGGDPNCGSHMDTPVLAMLSSNELSTEALQLWLDAGANPMVGSPSPLFKWASYGRDGLIRQAIEKSACPVKLVYEHDGNFYSPPLAMALSRGHVELAKWMIEEQGCSLDHFGENNEETCRSYASGDTLAKLTAFLENASLRNKHKVALSAPRPRETGL